jgi:hypothetical protein
MLVSWELWSESNTKILKNKSTMPTISLPKIKLQARSWILAGAKHLGIVLPRE